MPTYEYACDSCGHGFEVFQKMADSPVKDCPQCGAVVRRVLTGGIAISFKGSGFYVNDASTAASVAPASNAKTGKPGVTSASPAASSVPAASASGSQAAGGKTGA